MLGKFKKATFKIITKFIIGSIFISIIILFIATQRCLGTLPLYVLAYLIGDSFYTATKVKQK